MRIGIDARFFNQSGVGRYLRNLIENLQSLDKKNQYFIFLLPQDFRQFSRNDDFQKILAPFSWYGFAEQFNLPKLLNRYKLDLVHFPHFNAPIFYSGKFVVTIHDLIHQHFQMRRATTLNTITYKVKQFGYGRVFRTAIKKSEHILVPSNFVKNGLIDEWKVNQDKISVTLEAVDGKLTDIKDKLSEEKVEDILNKFNIKTRYLFYVGNAHPHKNIGGLIKAFLILKRDFPDLELVLSGYDHYFWKRIKDENQHEGIIYTDYVSDEELVVLYKNALCFVIPSFEEGFGIPILEAMACDCPVVSSNAGALPEVGGDAAIYFDPHNMSEIVKGVEMVIKTDNLRRELIEKGKKRYRQFSWEKLAMETLEVYLKCV